MATAAHSWSKFPTPVQSLPNLRRYNDPADVFADFQRGLRMGSQAARRAKRGGSWNVNDETFAVDIALDKVPIAQSMSFAFLRGFASGFRETYRARLRFF